jgi:hypothetical protein
VQPSWETDERIDPASCLTYANQIMFSVSPDSEQRMAGRLELDDIELHTLKEPAQPTSEIWELGPWDCYSYGGGTESPAGKRDPGACDRTQPVTRMTFDVAFESEEHWMTMESEISHPDDLAHEVARAVHDVSAQHSLKFSAQFEPRDPDTQPSGRFEVELWCDHLIPGSGVGVLHGFEAAPGWSNYTLPLASFVASDYPLGFHDLDGCLRNVDGVSFGTNLSPGEVSAGTLEIQDVVLQ